jgi:hypothetical protein
MHALLASLICLHQHRHALHTPFLPAKIAESLAGLPLVGRSRRKPADYRRGEEPLALPPGREGSAGGGGVITPPLMSRQTKTPVRRSAPTKQRKK